MSKKVLLYSGGVDSWLIDKLWKPDVKLYVDIGTDTSKGEIEHLPKDVTVAKLRDLHLLERKEDFILPLRNLYLIAMATNYGDEICLGANATDATLDKTDEFAAKMSDLLTYMYQPQKWTQGREIKVVVPFRKYTKGQLLEQYVKEGGDIRKAYEETWTCFTPNGAIECHACRACFLKFMAFVENGFDFTKAELDSYRDYLINKVEDKNYKDRLYSREQVIAAMEFYGIR